MWRRGATIPYLQRNKIRITLNSSKSLQVSRDQSEIFKVLKEQDHYPVVLYPAKLHFKIEREIKTFLGKQN